MSDSDNRRDLLAPLSNLRWVEGFLSGTNMAYRGKDALADIDPALVRDWVDKYCKKNPKDDVSDAAAELFVRLTK